jgi:hypothetical protein
LKKPEPARPFKIALLLALCALFLALILARQSEPRRRAERTSKPVPSSSVPAARRARRPAPRALGARKSGADGCWPGAFLICHEGDVWSEDSCGRVESKVEECDVQLCHDAACDEPDSQPCLESAEGRCDNEIVRSCYAGRAQSIDCAARGLRCVQGEEGAECGPLLEPGERCAGPLRCEGDVLLACLGGRRERIDCRLLGGRCEALSPTEPVRCVQHKIPIPGAADCGACGCPASALGEQACDGRDEDGDGHVDEGRSCGPVPIIAFAIASDAGESNYSREEIEADIGRANVLLAAQPEEPELRFELSELIVTRDASLLELSQQELSDVAFDARFHPPREAFYVPVVFTDQLFAPGEVPRIGASTLPNGYCGSVQRGRAPPVGIIAVSKARASTTLLHELGHFFGLCHTHERTFGLQSVAEDPARAVAMLCDAPCNHEGDDMCDTPPDPGPEGCRYDLACRPLCMRGEAPDAENLMSYYTLCRDHFSAQQRRTFEHTLALRRAWHPCLSKECPCELAGNECPLGMVCRPSTNAPNSARCMLAGPRAAGADCDAHAECAQGLCLEEANRKVSHCVRPCRASTSGCTCSETNLGFSMCREDTGS